ncbi:abscission/NoCut checkpoint regulator isoform X2 [Tribolium castaneum]|uniref:Zinc finger FYVE domain-containing protein 19-like Protein n=1 Tax=Tribolium castaneum TaxID=7070 RepID=D6WTA0_TRICA|nr:PREDICTED: abscission/NoCut checkpoint regulator [Tribolium castaneum]EFA06685.2 Zinc finger FYVE domain-containing protein 19-like Protein [Tribolium castaneum]|eukprot:XP_008195414.1 PREDICTED: abscission/NoCut checkpoint regulator [Tribolium castaneum]
MSCNHCNTKFNFFHKEMGCSNCGLSFCNKCLKQKCKIPNKGTGEFNVCKLCYSKLASGTSATLPQIAPPDAFIKRLENLENPAAPPITMYKNDPKIQALRSGLSPADQKILDRLEKLKDEKGPPPSEGELRRRLASLKGENDYVEGPSRLLFQVDSRTDQQKADSLLEQFVNERDIELAHNPQEEIEARLATLREQGVRPNEGPYISNLHDSSSSEEEVDKITKKIMDEVAIEERCPKSKKLTPSSSNEDENNVRSSPELPWCVLCNNDAKFRCFDCGGDLYCSECNVEVHKNWGDTDHKVVPYKSK